METKKKMKPNELILPWNGGMAIVSLFGLAPLVIHLWTIVLAMVNGGVLHALVSLPLPLVSWIYWVIYIFKTSGTLATPYCIVNISYALFVVLAVIIDFTNGRRVDNKK
ncbi:MAG TPA: hypothetical protein PLN69_10585 [bacterium]|nr:hypothetical protein [bacterium]